MLAFANKVALVTGAGSGIGATVAAELAAGGADVLVTDIDLARAEATVKTIIAAGGSAVAVSQDTAVPEESERAVQVALDRFGRLDLAVNNAGIGGAGGRTGDVSVDAWTKVVDINLNGVFYGLRHQIPALLASGGGSIVNIASIHGMVATPLGGNSAYVATKHAVVGLTRNAAAEYAAEGVRINAVGPGYIDTPLLGQLPEEARAQLVAKHPIGRLGTAEDVSHLVVFLLSEQAAFITGSYYMVDGGYTAI